MKLSKVIIDNIKGNTHSYREYFLATMLSASALSMSLFLIKHPDIPMNSFTATFMKAVTAVNVMIGLFLFVFITYSEYNFIRNRSRDYALFKILGMRRRQLYALHFWESFTAFFGGTICGIGVSLLFAKFIFMLFSKVLDIEQMKMYFPGYAIAAVLLIFTGAFIVIQIISSVVLSKLEIKKILLFERESQKMKRPNIWLSMLSFFLLATAYWLAYTSDNKTLSERILPVLLLVMAGMFLFYRQLLPWVLGVLSNRKGFYYRGINLLWISDLKYRINNFSVMLFLITLLMSIGLTGFTAVMNIVSVEINTVIFPMPAEYPTIAISYGSQESSSASIKPVEKVLSDFNLSYSKKSCQLFYKKSDSLSRRGKTFIKRSELPLLIPDTLVSKLDFRGKETINLSGQGGELLNRLNKFYFFRGDIYAIEDSVAERFSGDEKKISITLFGYKTKKNLGKALLNWTYNEEGVSIMNADMTTYIYYLSRRFYLLLSFYFVIVFYVCAGCMLFFKFYYSTQEERKKYLGYAKVGLSYAETKKSSSIQMAILFFVPNIFSIVNMSFAMQALMNSSQGEWSILPMTLKIVLFTITIQLLFFLFLRRKTFI